MEWLYREARNGGTHSAAGWTLRKWQMDRSPIDQDQTQANIKEWTSKRDWHPNSVGITMLRIPDGEFIMGSPIDDEDAQDNEKPPHRVRISEFWLSDREVTVGQFRAVMAADGTGAEQLDAGEEGLPMTEVSWLDAVEFCNKLSEQEGVSSYYDLKWANEGWLAAAEIAEPRGVGYRLPTEAEWEYACRAKSIRNFCFGDDDLRAPKLLPEYAQFDARTAAVCGSRLPNGWGLFDVHGNLYEWCWDCYDENYYTTSETSSKQTGETVRDPQGPVGLLFRVYRSGSWKRSPVGSWKSPAGSCRAACRNGNLLVSNVDDLGFRLAATRPASQAQVKQAKPGE
jgi:formylglycine-generating enzyme required for sulfatase activity